MSIFLGRRHSHGLSMALGKDRINLRLRYPLIWILVCSYPLIAFGCSKQTVLFPQDGPGKKVYRQASPSELSDYIRTVFKISTGNNGTISFVFLKNPQTHTQKVSRDLLNSKSGHVKN